MEIGDVIREQLTTFNLIIPNTICVTNIMTFSLLFISTWQYGLRNNQYPKEHVPGLSHSS
jgi:hypothetical protein